MTNSCRDTSHPSEATWRTSSYSGGNNECVEVACGPLPTVPVRDSKRADGSVLRFSPASWNAFLHHLA